MDLTLQKWTQYKVDQIQSRLFIFFLDTMPSASSCEVLVSSFTRLFLSSIRAESHAICTQIAETGKGTNILHFLCRFMADYGNTDTQI